MSPVKRELQSYSDLENKWMSVIASKFGFMWPMNEWIKEIDKAALEYEWKIMIGEIFPPKKTQEQAKRMFINIFNAYKPSM